MSGAKRTRAILKDIPPELFATCVVQSVIRSWPRSSRPSNPYPEGYVMM